MRDQFDDEDNNPDIKAVVAEYREALRKRLQLAIPIVALVAAVLVVLAGTYSIDPGEIGVVRTFGKMTDKTKPGLHFIVPWAQRVDIVNVAKVRRAEIGFRSSKGGPKRVISESQMLTGDENIVEAEMIVQFKIADPVKYLFRLNDPEKSLHVAAEVALRGVVGQSTITSGLEKLDERTQHPVKKGADKKGADKKGADKKGAGKDGGGKDGAGKDGAGKVAAKADAGAPDPDAAKKSPKKAEESTDILTTGRESAQIAAMKKLQELLDLYESGLKIVDLKLQAVDAPDEVKDAFHDVVRAREEREKKINKALGYQQDRIPRARGAAKKIQRAAEAYARERVLLAEGEAKRFSAILAEYRKARHVTRERLHLETLEKILKKVDKKVFIDADVAKGSVPILPLGGNLLGGKGGK